MELNIIESKAKRLVFELKGADHTICNALKTELYNDKDVSIATYSIRHPLIKIPKFIIETSSKDPKSAVASALGRIEKQNKDFLTKFKSISK